MMGEQQTEKEVTHRDVGIRAVVYIVWMAATIALIAWLVGNIPAGAHTPYITGLAGFASGATMMIKFHDWGWIVEGLF